MARFARSAAVKRAAEEALEAAAARADEAGQIGRRIAGCERKNAIKRLRADAGSSHGPPQVLPTMDLQLLGDPLMRIAAQRKFERSDFIGGERLSAAEWADLHKSS